MTIRTTFPLVVAILFGVAIVACSDDDDPVGGGPNDNTPPAISSVSNIDAYHIAVTFDEEVTRDTAEDESHWTLTETLPFPVAPRGPGSAPDDPVPIAAAVVYDDDNRTVTISTQSSMAGLTVDLSVTGISDVTGNQIDEAVTRQFTGSNTPDAAAPTIVARAPLPDAISITIAATVTVRFSEAVQTTTSLFSSPAGDVAFDSFVDGAQLVLIPDEPLSYNTTYTLSIFGTDYAGNIGAPSEWSFTTVPSTEGMAGK